VQPNYTPGTPPLPPIVAFIQGGEPLSDESSSPTYLVYIDPNSPTKARVQCMSGDPTAVSFGYVPNATGGLALYAVLQANYDVISMLMLSDPLNNFTSAAGVPATAAPSGFVALTQVITDPTEFRQKPAPGELAFPAGYAQTRVPSYFADGAANNFGFASPVQFMSVAQSSGDVTNAQAILTPWITEWRNMGRTAAYANEPNHAVSLNGLWGWNNSSFKILGPTTAQVANTSLLSTEAMPPGAPYQIEAILNSSDAGDEAIGICFGYVVADGKAFALHAFRTPGGTMHDAVVAGTLPGTNNANWGLFTVGLNLLQNEGVILGSNTSALTFGDGTAGSVANHITSYVPNATTAGTNGWANKGNVRIKASYDGAGNFTISTTDFNDTSGNYVSAATITFSLASVAVAAGVYKGVDLSVLFEGTYGGSRWGFAAYDQAATTFSLVSGPDYYARYVDYTPGNDGTDPSLMYFYTGNSALGSSGWESYAIESTAVLLPGRIVYSDVNNTLWQVRRDGTLNPLPIIAYTGSAGTQILTT
jgi:hypothetical protein